MTGRESGLIAKLRKDFPSLKSIHCLAHKLELVVHDACKSVTGCNHFEIFISKLYTFYHQSPKNARLLHDAATHVNISLLKIGQIFSICWVASSFSTVRAVWQDFPALATQMQNASVDVSRTDLDRQKCSGLLRKLSSTGFVKDLALMKDVLRELQSLSLKLQSRNTSLTDASRWTYLTMEVLEAMKTTSGKSLAKAENINKGQFLQAVIDNLSVRLPDSEFTELLAPLEPSCWPKDRNSLVLYGEKEIHDLAKHLGVPTRAAVEEYRFWKLEGDSPGKTIKRLITASKTYLATSAECERGFSAMSDTANKRRNCLRAKSLSSVLFLDVNGPPLEQFDPKSFVLSWLKDGHRLSTATKTGRQAQTKADRPLWTVLGVKVMD
ncbi:hypothetical protein IRJ41_005853 [Triplophysa rosa]|uniref:HAT C-terminal dimerisation domain-containing protein n=1 Tax=Triplophysa rosa TaxID=992332 RepID=A0A9W7WYV1_TRIRA|nr:hypothetical protein IRJ41_005853 [Triplophysa rosa]